MPGHVYWKNREGVYLGCNDNQARTLGFQYGLEVVGKTDFDLPWEKQTAQSYRKNDLRIMATGEAEELEEVAFLKGTEIVFLSKKVPLKNKQGVVIGILGISFDITKHKATEKKILSLVNEQPTQTTVCENSLKNNFICNMEHDIRTPFMGILGMTKILNEYENDPTKKQIINDISECAEELLHYSFSILDYSKVESGMIPVLAKNFDLTAVLKSVISIETPAAKSKKLSFTTEFDNYIPTTLIGDEYRLKRILINLLGNAIKFTSHGFVKLITKCLKNDERTIIVRFIIEDSGIGIEEEQLNQIYEKFVRATPSNRSLYKGLGLGLKIVKQFVEEMEGDIEIKSTLGQGTQCICTFSFKLPLIQDRAEREQQKEWYYGRNPKTQGAYR
jgi:two-component system aerobic respiration control sensor histidine kinase ArcB